MFDAMMAEEDAVGELKGMLKNGRELTHEAIFNQASTKFKNRLNGDRSSVGNFVKMHDEFEYVSNGKIGLKVKQSQSKVTPEPVEQSQKKLAPEQVVALTHLLSSSKHTVANSELAFYEFDLKEPQERKNKVYFKLDWVLSQISLPGFANPHELCTVLNTHHRSNFAVFKGAIKSLVHNRVILDQMPPEEDAVEEFKQICLSLCLPVAFDFILIKSSDKLRLRLMSGVAEFVAFHQDEFTVSLGGVNLLYRPRTSQPVSYPLAEPPLRPPEPSMKPTDEKKDKCIVS